MDRITITERYPVERQKGYFLVLVDGKPSQTEVLSERECHEMRRADRALHQLDKQMRKNKILRKKLRVAKIAIERLQKGRD